MKRHPSLIPISRQHRSMLMLAQLLKRNAPPYKGLPTDAPGKVSYAKGLWEKFIRKHFKVEETTLGSFVKEMQHDELSTVWDSLEKEHQSLKVQFEALDEQQPNPVTMNALGFALEKHIRTEERIFFQKLQDVAGDRLDSLHFGG